MFEVLLVTAESKSQAEAQNPKQLLSKSPTSDSHGLPDENTDVAHPAHRTRRLLLTHNASPLQ